MLMAGEGAGSHIEVTGVRRLLKTLRMALDLVSNAAPRELTITILLTFVCGFITAGELLIGRKLVQLLLAAGSSTSKTAGSARVSDLVPWLVALAAIMIFSSLVNMSVAELRTRCSTSWSVGERSTSCWRHRRLQSWSLSTTPTFMTRFNGHRRTLINTRGRSHAGLSLSSPQQYRRWRSVPCCCLSPRSLAGGHRGVCTHWAHQHPQQQIRTQDALRAGRA